MFPDKKYYMDVGKGGGSKGPDDGGEGESCIYIYIYVPYTVYQKN